MDPLPVICIIKKLVRNTEDDVQDFSKVNNLLVYLQNKVCEAKFIVHFTVIYLVFGQLIHVFQNASHHLQPNSSNLHKNNTIETAFA
jgi:hypothetical protein